MRKPFILEDAHAVLQPSFLKDLSDLGQLTCRRNADINTYNEAVKTAEILVVSGGSKVRADYFDRLRALKLITVFGVGYDGVDVSEARRRGVRVTHTPGVMKDDVADLALAMLINVSRELIAAHKFVESGAWLEGSLPLMTPLSGMKVGLAGLGRIGQEVALRLEACRCDIAYFATRPHAGVPYTYFPDLRDLALWAQALIVVLPLTPQTRGLINADILKALGPQGYLVNVARGKIVDTAALIAALDSRTIRGCALDVFESEPCRPLGLINRPNVVLAPHYGSATRGTRDKMAALVLDNIRAYLEGRELLTPVPEMTRP